MSALYITVVIDIRDPIVAIPITKRFRIISTKDLEMKTRYEALCEYSLVATIVWTGDAFCVCVWFVCCVRVCYLLLLLLFIIIVIYYIIYYYFYYCYYYYDYYYYYYYYYYYLLLLFIIIIMMMINIPKLGCTLLEDRALTNRSLQPKY